MHRSLFAIALTPALAFISGCSRQPSPPVQSEGASHLDRFKGAKSAAHPKAKDKGITPRETGGGGGGREKRKRN
jgi:hypothetical protein